jgi:hypothetical protein
MSLGPAPVELELPPAPNISTGKLDKDEYLIPVLCGLSKKPIRLLMSPVGAGRSEVVVSGDTVVVVTVPASGAGPNSQM